MEAGRIGDRGNRWGREGDSDKARINLVGGLMK